MSTGHQNQAARRAYYEAQGLTNTARVKIQITGPIDIIRYNVADDNEYYYTSLPASPPLWTISDGTIIVNNSTWLAIQAVINEILSL